MSMVRAYPGIHIGPIADAGTRDALKAIDTYLRDASRAVQAPTGGGSTSSVPTDASVVTAVAETSFPNSRRLVASSPVTVTDGGAGGSITIAGATIVVGPGSATSGNIATFSGTTGKVIADSGVALTNVVTGPAASVDNAIVRFDGASGKIIQDYTSGQPTISDTGVVAVSAGMTLTGAVTNTSTYSVGTNALNFLSTVANSAGNYAFDFKDTIAVNRTGTSYLLGIRDSANTYRFRVQSTSGTKMIIGNSAGTLSSTMAQAAWTLGDNATGTSADPGLKVTGGASATVSGFTAGTTNSLKFYSGSNPGSAPLQILDFSPDGSGSTSNDNYIRFVKTNTFLNSTPNDFVLIDWVNLSGAGPTDARRFLHGAIDNLNDIYISQGGRWGNQAARVGYAYDTAQFQTWDLMAGGGFAFTGVGGTEPVT